MCTKYSIFTDNGRSLICRAFLDFDFSEQGIDYNACLDMFNILNSYVIEYIYRKMGEVCSVLKNQKQNGKSHQIECDSEYTYSYNLYNQFNKIKGNLFNSNGENIYKITISDFIFDVDFDPKINKLLNKILTRIYQEYITEFINNIFK